MDQKELLVFDALFQDDWNVQCPSCGDDRAHFSAVTVQKGRTEIVINRTDSAELRTRKRDHGGGRVVLECWGECGHFWRLGIEYVQGSVLLGAEETDCTERADMWKD